MHISHDKLNNLHTHLTGQGIGTVQDRKVLASFVNSKKKKKGKYNDPKPLNKKDLQCLN